MAGINKKQLVILLAVFAAVLAAHAGYFMFSGDACEAAGWSQYISEGKYFLGASYALSVSFMIFAFMKLRENKRAALPAAAARRC